MEKSKHFIIFLTDITWLSPVAPKHISQGQRMGTRIYGKRGDETDEETEEETDKEEREEDQV